MDKDFLMKTFRDLYFEYPNKKQLIKEIEKSIEEIKEVIKNNPKDAFVKRSFGQEIWFQKELLKLAKKL